MTSHSESLGVEYDTPDELLMDLTKARCHVGGRKRQELEIVLAACTRTEYGGAGEDILRLTLDQVQKTVGQRPLFQFLRKEKMK